MKSNLTIFISLTIFCFSSGVCLSSNESQTDPLTYFHLDSKLGIRVLAQQSTVSAATTENLVSLKSPNEAFLYSLAIPGMGQLYTGAKHGYIYTAAEVGLLVSYFILQNNAENIREDYRDVVRQNLIFIDDESFMDCFLPKSFEDWDLIEDFEHATQYETWNNPYSHEDSKAGIKTLCRTGKWYWKDLDPSLKDMKSKDIQEDLNINSKFRLEARALRDRANNTFQTARNILGLVILNHVFSAVEARITTKRWNKKQQQTRSLEIGVQTDTSTGALTGMLVFKKKF